MGITAENKPIVAKLAMFKDLDLVKARSAVIGMESSPWPFLKDDFPIPPAAWVIGTSVQDIYKTVTGENWPFGGPKAEMASEQAFRLLHVTPIVVSEADFIKLTVLKKRVTPEQFNQIVQTRFELPLEVSVEK